MSIGPIVTDVWKLIFHRLNLYDQAVSCRVCKLWKGILYELQYEYGLYQSLRGSPKSLDLPVAIQGRFHIHGVKGTFVLSSLYAAGQPYHLRFRDMQTNQEQLIFEDPIRSYENLKAARWVANNRFVTVSQSPPLPFFEIALWKISTTEADYQITKIAEKEFLEKGRIFEIDVLPLHHRLFLNVLFPDVGVLHPERIQKKPFMIDFRGDQINIKEIVDQPFSIYYSFFSNSSAIFCFDFPVLTAYELTNEGKACVAWKTKDFPYSAPSFASDRWFVSITRKAFINSDEAKEEVVFQFLDASTGKEAFVFIQPYGNCIEYASQFCWLKDNFFILLVGKELRIFHIPTKSLCTSLIVNDQFLYPPVVTGVFCPIHVVQIDREVLRILFEDATGLRVFQTKLENQHGKTSLLPPPQVLVPPKLPSHPTKWSLFVNGVYKAINPLLCLWKWFRSFF